MTIIKKLHYYNYICLTAFFRTTSVGWPRKINHSGFYWSKRWWGGSGISWTICKSFAPRYRQITMPVPQHSVFTGRMPFLLPNQQRQSSKDNLSKLVTCGTDGWLLFSGFQELVTLTLTLDRVIQHTVMHQLSSSIYISSFIEIRKTLLWMDYPQGPLHV